MNRENWFKELIQEFRNAYKDLSGEEKNHISNLDDLTEPCQILSVTFENPPLTKTFILHIPNIDDKTVWEYGPIEPYEAFELFDKIIVDSVWDFPIDTDEGFYFYEDELTVRTLLDASLLDILREIQGRVFRPPDVYSDAPGLKSYFLKKSAIWTYYGDITNIDPEKVAIKIIQDGKSTYKNNQAQLKSKPIVESANRQKIQKTTNNCSESVYNWHGIYLFPAVSIGNTPRLSFSERLFGGLAFFQLGTVVFEDKFDERNFIATHNGFIGIEEAKNKVALEMLNVLVAALLLRGTQLFVIRDHELGKFQYSMDSKQFGGWSVPDTPRLLIFDEQRQSQLRTKRKTKLTHEDLLQALRDAEVYLKNKELCFYIPFLIESHTHFAELEYTQSFYMSWVIIETYLTKKWKAVLDEKTIPSKRIKKLTNHAMWSIDYIIESMNLQNELPNRNYEILMSLKKNRNLILHGTVKASKNDAGKAYSIASDICFKTQRK